MVTNAKNRCIDMTLRHEEILKSVSSTPFTDLTDEMIRDNAVIELGAASTPQERLWKFDPKEYVCVEPTLRRKYPLPPNVRYAERDDDYDYEGVTYLEEKVSDSSVVVVSSALFDRQGILINEEYTKKLIDLIFKKTIPGQLSLHTITHGFEREFLDSGFEFVFGRGDKRWEGLTPEEVEAGYTNGTNRIIPMFFRKPAA